MGVERKYQKVRQKSGKIILTEEFPLANQIVSLKEKLLLDQLVVVSKAIGFVLIHH